MLPFAVKSPPLLENVTSQDMTQLRHYINKLKRPLYKHRSILTAGDMYRVAVRVLDVTSVPCWNNNLALSYFYIGAALVCITAVLSRATRVLVG